MNGSGHSLKARITPTPSGYLHLGNALNFVYVWLLAKSNNAKILLRIDDLDKERVRSEYVDDIFRTLEWLGIDYDEGPDGPDSLMKNYSQNLRIDRYREVIADLENDLFVCTCSRKEILQESMDGQYPGTCRNLNLDIGLLHNYAMRMLTPEGTFIEWNDLKQGPQQVNLYSNLRDFVLLRKDGIPAYQIASLVDDIDMGVNILVRGEDLKDSTAAQIFLSQKLGFEQFTEANFLHHPLLRDPKGQKISKSAGALSIQELRKGNSKPGDIITQIGHMLGISHTVQLDNIRDLLLYVGQIEGLGLLTV